METNNYVRVYCIVSYTDWAKVICSYSSKYICTSVKTIVAPLVTVMTFIAASNYLLNIVGGYINRGI
jgi:hypothetical protein